MLEECVSQLDEPFRRSEIVGWFRRHHPGVNESTLGAHIQAATANATNRAQNNALGTRPPLLRRIDHGLYARVQPPSPVAFQPPSPSIIKPAPVPAKTSSPQPGRSADLVLIGCVRTKKPAPTAAAELFDSPLFERRHHYATSSGLPWFILSAKFGLLAPDDVIGPYDVYLKEQSPEYRKAWGEFVVAQLGRQLPSLRGLTIEVHAGEAYVTPLRAPLAVHGATLVAPLAHLRQGEQLAWYGTSAGTVLTANTAPTVPPAPPQPRADVQHLTEYLSNVSLALSPKEVFTRGRDGLTGPGLYSWWVDEPGAADLTNGLGGLPVAPGLIYAGQAGATRRLSGKRSNNTLWGRVAGMHLGRKAEFSTFRRTLAAVLCSVIPLSTEDDPRLSAWMDEHLRVVMLSVPDAGDLGHQESAVLDALDPPLNLQGRPRTPIREELTRARSTAWK
jgi:hypothetical protein